MPQHGGLLVAADRINVPPDRRAVQKEMEHNTPPAPHQYRRRDERDLSGTQPAETVREAGYRKAPEITSASPRATFIIPSVGMNG
jgi:hypothetical protein